MSATNRAATINKLQKVLKQNFQPVKPPADRSVLEHLLYACCLEDADFEQADEAFARLQESYFDWNEVRVTTVNELTESVGCLADPSAAANRIKSALHALFESHYSFDLDFLKKENLGKAVQRFQSYKGVTPFVVSYVTQNGLGGHSIPIDGSAIDLALVIGLITEKEAAKHAIPGLERAVPKTKGVEFGSLLHQLAVSFRRAPHAPATRKLILDIDADAKDRYPARRGKKAATAEPETKAKAKTATKKKAPAAKATTKSTKASAKKDAPAPAKKKAAKPKAAATKKPAKKSASKSLARKKPR